MKKLCSFLLCIFMHIYWQMSCTEIYSLMKEIFKSTSINSSKQWTNFLKKYACLYKYLFIQMKIKKLVNNRQWNEISIITLINGILSSNQPLSKFVPFLSSISVIYSINIFTRCTQLFRIKILQKKRKYFRLIMSKCVRDCSEKKTVRKTEFRMVTVCKSDFMENSWHYKIILEILKLFSSRFLKFRF